jgi:hypothetical protein
MISSAVISNTVCGWLLRTKNYSVKVVRVLILPSLSSCLKYTLSRTLLVSTLPSACLY